MSTAAFLSASECQSKLQEIYEEVQAAVEATRRRNPTEDQLSGYTDFLEEWNSKPRQVKHLPLSLELISKRFAETKRGEILYRCPYGPTTDKSPRFLLLMAGFSTEQLVLSIAFHHRYAAENGSLLAGIVPFIGKDAWNRVEGDLAETLPLAMGDSEAATVLELLHDAREVTPGDPAQVFKSVLDWSRNQPDAAIALDVTGGQKPMDTGGTYAAMYLGLRAYYLDFDEYDIPHRRPFPESLKYVQLALPSAVFSHDARKAVVELFSHRRFQAAFDRLVELSEEINSPDVRQYFEQSDRDDVRDCAELVEACNAWMSGNYCHESMASDRLYGTFCAVEPKEPKTILNSMLETFGNRESEKSRDLFHYLEDEYWRLRTMLYLGDETNNERKCADLQEASEMIREVVVGSCALAEIAIDSVFHLSFVEVKTVELTEIRLEFGNSPPDVKTIEHQSNLVKTHRPDFARSLDDMLLPLHRFPLSSTGPKTKLIRGDTPRFRIFVPQKEIVKSLKSGGDVEKAFRQAFVGTGSVGPFDKRLELDVQVSMKQLLQLEDNTWETQWGSFGDAKAAWMANRNAIAHMRATATEAQLDIAGNAIEIYLPRFLGMLAILSGENAILPITDEAAWRAGCEAIDPPRGPWHQPDKNETQLRKWLRLPNLR